MIDEPRFAVDVMLGKLARWLRLMGFDTFYSNNAEDSFLASLCLEEGRILLTRDRPLHEQMGKDSYFVEAIHLTDQLKEVVEAYQLFHFDPTSRCSLCNGTLETCSKSSVKDHVPPYVYSTQGTFFRCGTCGKLYWNGTHVSRIQALLVRLNQNSETEDKDGA